MALDLPILVRVLNKKSKREVHDNDGLLPHIVAAWVAAGHALPIEKDNLHWAVQSKIPAREGLKVIFCTVCCCSSSLCDSTGTTLELMNLLQFQSMLNYVPKLPLREVSTIHGPVQRVDGS